MPDTIARIRVFVASPGDVLNERDRLEAVIKELNRTIAPRHHLHIELVRWETHARSGFGADPQDVINQQLLRSEVHPADIFVGIMWKRLGTPTNRAESGTVEEFERAHASLQEYGKPAILFYFNSTPYHFRDMEELEQYQNVLQFRKTLPARGGLVWSYEGVEEFERLIREHLTHEVLELGERLHREQSAQLISAPSAPADRIPGTTTTAASLTPVPGVHNLPAHLSSFVGREHELEEIRGLLSDKRLITVLGPGGSGKTRLAIEIGHGQLDEYAGVWIVELAASQHAEIVPSMVANAMGIREQPGQSVVDALVSHLSRARTLLILDNCEHLVDACADLAQRLLRSCPELVIISTSRTPLRVAGEVVYPVLPLSLPDSGQPLTLANAAQSEAVRLFVERASAIRRGFELTEGNVSTIAQICQRLDGIPLALELAAARAKALTVEQILTRLQDRFRLLTGGNRADLPRQQTLRALIDWSYDLLNEPERWMFNRLSVFANGCTLEAAEAVCSGDGIDDLHVLDLIMELIDKSLLICDESGDEFRYRQLESIREYGVERLGEHGDVDRLRMRHRDYFIDLVTQAESELIGPQQEDWLNRLEDEHDNLRMALQWTIDHNEHEAALRIAGGLWRFWLMQGHLNEGRLWLDQALAPSSHIENAHRASAWCGAGVLAESQGDFTSATEFFNKSLDVWKQLGDPAGIATAVNSLGNMAHEAGDYGRALSLYEEALGISRDIGDERGTARTLVNLGWVAADQGNVDMAATYLSDGMKILQRIGDRRSAGTVLNHLGYLEFVRGHLDEAEAVFRESVDLWRTLGDPRGIAMALLSLGDTMMYKDDPDEARVLLEEALYLAQSLHDRKSIAAAFYSLGRVASFQQQHDRAAKLLLESLDLYEHDSHQARIAECLEALAVVAHTTGALERAARLFSGAEKLREESGVPLPEVDRLNHQSHVAAARDALGEDCFMAAWSDGNRATLAEILADARQLSTRMLPVLAPNKPVSSGHGG